ncbi:MAG TPA: ATP-binding cassette domain-containing protein [Steroidobacteraceae bacterium]|nr:ATP-binding cassette domain-containing protein [Steroidobacteraceae bacterium]
MAIPVVVGKDLRKVFRAPGNGGEVRALDGVSIEVRAGELTALVGPDGAGKTTLIRLMAGLFTADAGTLTVLGIDPAAQPQRVQDRIGYMPQKFGLYEDLSVQENLDLYADLHGVGAEERSRRYPQLMQMTDLGRFTGRLAGRLSGGMKQKLGLACTLVRSPELLLLDEPTVGVDPLSRRELWAIVEHLVREQGLTVLTSTSYLDEAERAARVLVLHEGRALAQSEPAAVTRIATGRSVVLDPNAGESARSLQARLLDDPEVIDAVPDGGLVRLVRTGEPATGRDRDMIAGLEATPVEPRFEDGFMVLLRGAAAHEAGVDIQLQRPLAPSVEGSVVEVHDLVKTFGDFTAVNHVSFEVRRGEIFGLLGPNGAGKTTTFRMLCGLSPPTAGILRIAGLDVSGAGAAARARLGYVAQKFSLYGALTVAENLEFFASAYGLRGAQRRERIDWALRQFDLERHARTASGELPGGFKQRLAMGAALLHEPDILFLDEPTSGADPLARRAFWRRITALAEQGVTVIVTTHFMQEAEYCDHIAIMDGGRVLARGSPAQIRRLGRARDGREVSMEDAFIAVVETARAREGAARA